MAIYLSLDTEATGLTEECVLIQLAVVPVDVKKRHIYRDMGKEWLVHCEPFEKLKPTLNDWVIEHNEGLIRKANSEGLAPLQVRQELKAYLQSAPVKALFAPKNRPILLGKSLSALDLPLMARTFGADYMRECFHHHTVDVTCFARSLVDAGLFPEGTESTSKLLGYLGIRDDAKHTALSDAEDMAEAYLRMVDKLKPSLLHKLFPFLR
jgi:hypothetical protein